MAKKPCFQWANAPKDLDQNALKPSRSAKKRAATAVQNLAIPLFDLDPMTLADLALPHELIQALKDARNFKSHEAKRRQMQYIGRLMRDLPKETIAAIQIATNKITLAHIPPNNQSPS